jgi:hypothetical protein
LLALDFDPLDFGIVLVGLDAGVVDVEPFGVVAVGTTCAVDPVGPLLALAFEPLLALDFDPLLLDILLVGIGAVAVEPLGTTIVDVDPFGLVVDDVDPFGFTVVDVEPLGTTTVDVEPVGPVGVFGPLLALAFEPLLALAFDPLLLDILDALLVGMDTVDVEPLGTTIVDVEPLGLVLVDVEPFGIIVVDVEPLGTTTVDVEPVGPVGVFGPLLAFAFDPLLLDILLVLDFDPFDIVELEPVAQFGSHLQTNSCPLGAAPSSRCGTPSASARPTEGPVIPEGTYVHVQQLSEPCNRRRAAAPRIVLALAMAIRLAPNAKNSFMFCFVSFFDQDKSLRTSRK